MKIKYALIAAVLLVAATVTSVKSFKETTSLLDANVEALADGENVNPSICYSEYSSCNDRSNNFLILSLRTGSPTKTGRWDRSVKKAWNRLSSGIKPFSFLNE